MMTRHLRTILFLLFAVSGFTGLIYESIWSHYLKLFLGHAAYAQTLVLAIFMGGMAIGAWLASRWSAKWPNLLLAYAVVEGIIGLMGVLFHPLFQLILDISFNSIIPGLDSPFTIQLYKWTTSAVMILPQSILLGMTFPLMSNGIIRKFPETPGQSLSMLYFTNSLGAATGVLVSGFLLIAAVGLPGTILFAGIINILLAVVVYGLAKGAAISELPKTASQRHSTISILLLGAAFITGMASFIYEVAWLRMLSMVLGASTHSFELMLSAFITGLAFGGLFIRKHVDRLRDPMLTAGIIQIVMGLCALATVPLYNYTFDLMGYLMSALKTTDAGYTLFTLSGHFIAFMVMLPATFCAGMTLPLFTRILMQQNYGEKSIGQIYACNTLGAIAGVSFTIYIAMPMTGLKNTMATGAGLDVLLGFILLSYATTRAGKTYKYSIAATLLLFITAIFMVDFDFRRMSSSVYRTGVTAKDEDHKLVFHQDGKTSTVHVTSRADGLLTITTNGKPDAAINMNDDDQVGPDETTMVMIAAIAVAVKPDARAAANIGMGSGMTTHTLLAWPGIEKVDTIEIEPAMIEGAKNFRPRVERTFSDPRSHIHIDDAKTFFSNHKKKYDLILSEPSNPWVSGVSGLFTDEFYRQTSRYLSKDGMFVQWLHTYEISMDLVFSVLKSVDLNYQHYALYAANDGDLFILAKNDAAVDMPKPVIFDSPEMKHELSLIQVHNLQDIKARFLANEEMIRPYLNVTKPSVNSDYFPILDLNATRARYKQENAFDLARLRLDPVPLINTLLPEYESQGSTDVNQGLMFSTTKKISIAKNIYDFAISRQASSEETDYSHIELLIRLSDACDAGINTELWLEQLFEVASSTIPYLTQQELAALWERITPECSVELIPKHKIWLDLVVAQSRRDAELTADNAILLLKEDGTMELNHKKYIFGALMVALVKMQEYHAALKLWEQLAESLFGGNELPVSLLILYALSLEGAAADNTAIQSDNP